MIRSSSDEFLGGQCLAAMKRGARQKEGQLLSERGNTLILDN
jgi:hypothetical protein